MKIFLITDIHYGEDTNYPKFGGEEFVNHFGDSLDKYLPKIKSEIEKYDLVVNLGDLIKDNDTEKDLIQYKKSVKVLEMGKPVRHVMGNHDNRNISREQIASIIGESDTYYSFDLSGYHHIVLDPSRNQKGEPWVIRSNQASWLKKDLMGTDLRVLVYCHYPLDEQNIDSNLYFGGKEFSAFVENRAEIRGIFEESKKVVAVFSGHLHFGSSMEIEGIKYVTVPSFSENDGKGSPTLEYASVLVDNNNVKVDFLAFPQSF